MTLQFVQFTTTRDDAADVETAIKKLFGAGTDAAPDDAARASGVRRSRAIGIGNDEEDRRP